MSPTQQRPAGTVRLQLVPQWSNREMREAMRRAVPSVPGDILDAALEAALLAGAEVAEALASHDQPHRVTQPGLTDQAERQRDDHSGDAAEKVGDGLAAAERERDEARAEVERLLVALDREGRQAGRLRQFVGFVRAWCYREPASEIPITDAERLGAIKHHPVISGAEQEAHPSADRVEAAGDAGEVRRWQHRKRGTTYTEVGRAQLQCSPENILQEGDTIVVYWAEEGGKLWAREEGEFEDGRFRALTTTNGGGDAG